MTGGRGNRCMLRANANLQITIVGIASVAVLGAAIWFGIPSSTVPGASDDGAIVFEGDRAPSRISVHVSGAVVRPGLAELPDGSRIADAVAAAGGASVSADLGALNLATTVRDGDHIVVPERGEGSRANVDSGLVDINRATASELETLPGVGPVLAQRIVDHRSKHGLFTDVEDLLDVSGIGEAKLALMREAIASP